MTITFRTAIIVFLINFIFTNGLSQESNISKGKVNFRKQTRINSLNQIKQLKNGVLLVRLSNKINSIEALKLVGAFKRANKLETKQMILNKRIVEAFRLKYNFSPVYFIFSTGSDQILSKNFDQLVFLNDNLQPDSNITFTGKSFLMAEFGIIEQPDYSFNDGVYFASQSNNFHKAAKYYGGPNMRFGAIVIRDEALTQLQKPFPYYVRTFDTFIFKRKPMHTVRRINKKLHRYYHKVAHNQ